LCVSLRCACKALSFWCYLSHATGMDKLFWVMLPIIIPMMVGRGVKEGVKKGTAASSKGAKGVAEHMKERLTREHRSPKAVVTDVKANIKDGRFPLRTRDCGFYIRRATRRVGQGKPNGALRDTEQAITLDPTNSVAVVLRCQVLSGLGRSDEALTCLIDSVAGDSPEVRAAIEATRDAESVSIPEVLATAEAIRASLRRQAEPEPCCPVCLTEPATNLAAPCGHSGCHACLSQLQTCPLCREPMIVVVPAPTQGGADGAMGEEAADSLNLIDRMAALVTDEATDSDEA